MKQIKKRKARNKMHDIFKRVAIVHSEDGEIDKQACWLWTGATYKGKGGELRGRFSYLGEVQYAHRVVYQVYYGLTIEQGKVIRHKCDNPLCCNPFHLEVGAQKDNIDDRVVRERVGMKHKNLAYIMKMLELGASASIVKDKMKQEFDYDIDESVVRRIKRRELYKQIEWKWGDTWAANNARSSKSAVNRALASIPTSDIIDLSSTSEGIIYDDQE
jgi:hypothetical protein